MTTNASIQHTPGPWNWGTDWDTFEPSKQDTFEGDKYADLSLYAGNKPLIAIRVDHYDPIWDCLDPRAELSKADRDLIAAAPNMADTLAKIAELAAENTHSEQDGYAEIRDWACTALGLVEVRHA